MTAGYKLVQLASGRYSIHSLAHGETFHPVIGPVAEAEALYVNQLQLRERLKEQAGNFGKLVAVKISDDFQFAARMVDRGLLKKGKGKYATLSWDSLVAGEPDQELHRNWPIKKVPPKRKAVCR